MEYRRFGNALYVRLDPGEEILTELKKIAEKEEIRLACISGLGAVNKFTIGVFNTATKEYHSMNIEGACEILSLTGTVTRMNGEVYLHVHMSASDEGGKVYGGHLNRAVISATGEIVLQISEGEIGREFHEEIGLNLFKF